MNEKKLTVDCILDKKKNKQRIKMLTAYDYPMAKLVDQAGVDMILVGDSLANVVLGLDSTQEVGMFEMLHHCKAVSRGVERALIVGDMPYGSYEHDIECSIENARQFIDEAGCDAVKLEWFDGCFDVAQALVEAGIAVMGHVGLTPQTATQFKVQGKDIVSAQHIIDQAKGLAQRGCFSVVLECVPMEIAQIIAERINIPVIGIGAGPHCDGQVLVTHDVLGLYDRFQPKFAKRYASLGSNVLDGLKQYCQEVDKGAFPGPEHSFVMNPDELSRLEDLK